jgi:hypothetical protein
MKRFGLILSLFLSLFVAQSALACPKNCKCDAKGNVIYNYNTNTNYNTTDNSVKASVGNVSATGGSSKSDSSSVSNATGGAVTNSGNFNGTVNGGSIAAGAVQNTVKGGDSTSNATGISGGSFGGAGGSSSAVVEKGAVENNVTGGAGGVANADAAASADNSGNNTGTASVNVGGDVYEARRIPVATAYAAALTSGADTCLGSASGGVQLPVIGVSLGKTTLDKGCKLIKETHLLREFGTTPFEKAACFRARAGKEGKDIDAAMAAAGIKCEDVVAAPVVTAGAPVDPTVDEKIDRAFRKAVAK